MNLPLAGVAGEARDADVDDRRRHRGEAPGAPSGRGQGGRTPGRGQRAPRPLPRRRLRSARQPLSARRPSGRPRSVRRTPRPRVRRPQPRPRSRLRPSRQPPAGPRPVRQQPGRPLRKRLPPSRQPPPVRRRPSPTPSAGADLLVRQERSNSRAASARTIPARPSDTSRRRAGGCDSSASQASAASTVDLSHRPRREQPDHHRLRPLAGAPLPHVGDLGEVRARRTARAARAAPGGENPLMIASLHRVRAARRRARPAARPAPWPRRSGTSARARSACRCPVAVGSRSSSRVDLAPRVGGAVRDQRVQQPPAQVGVHRQPVRHVDVVAASRACRPAPASWSTRRSAR